MAYEWQPRQVAQPLLAEDVFDATPVGTIGNPFVPTDYFQTYMDRNAAFKIPQPSYFDQYYLTEAESPDSGIGLKGGLLGNRDVYRPVRSGGGGRDGPSGLGGPDGVAPGIGDFGFGSVDTADALGLAGLGLGVGLGVPGLGFAGGLIGNAIDGFSAPSEVQKEMSVLDALAHAFSLGLAGMSARDQARSIANAQSFDAKAAATEAAIGAMSKESNRGGVSGSASGRGQRSSTGSGAPGHRSKAADRGIGRGSGAASASAAGANDGPGSPGPF